MYQNILSFIKYHNLFTIILGLVLLLTAGVFASEEARNTIIGEEIVTEGGIDNSQLLAVDFDNFDFALKIGSVNEDPENYFVTYTYQTLAIQDNVWQGVFTEKVLAIPKNNLGGRDLGLYVQEELGEVVDYELKYLKEVQAIEREKGQTRFVASVEYTGLIGLVLDLKNKVFPAYEPVVEQPVPEQTTTYYTTSTADFTPEVGEESTDSSTPGVDEGTPGADESVCQNGANRPCGSDVGQCMIGVEICENGQWSGVCLGEVGLGQEICDEVDNDCDGEIDEGGVCGGLTSTELTPEATSTEPITTSIEPIVNGTTTPETATTTGQ